MTIAFQRAPSGRDLKAHLMTVKVRIYIMRHSPCMSTYSTPFWMQISLDKCEKNHRTLLVLLALITDIRFGEYLTAPLATVQLSLSHYGIVPAIAEDLTLAIPACLSGEEC